MICMLTKPLTFKHAWFLDHVCEKESQKLPSWATLIICVSLYYGHSLSYKPHFKEPIPFKSETFLVWLGLTFPHELAEGLPDSPTSYGDASLWTCNHDITMCLQNILCLSILDHPTTALTEAKGSKSEDDWFGHWIGYDARGNTEGYTA